MAKSTSVPTLDKRNCGERVMPIFLSEIDEWRENWSFDGTYLLAQAWNMGCRIPARHPEVWDSGGEDCGVDRLSNYLEANSQIDQGGARALAGRGDCQVFCQVPNWLSLRKGFLFFMIYTHFCFQEKLKCVNPEARTSLDFPGYFLQECSKVWLFCFTNIYQKHFGINAFNKLLSNLFGDGEQNECMILNNSASGCLKNICQSVIGKRSPVIV